MAKKSIFPTNKYVASSIMIESMSHTNPMTKIISGRSVDIETYINEMTILKNETEERGLCRGIVVARIFDKNNENLRIGSCG